MKTCSALLALLCALGLHAASAQTISALPSGGLAQSTDWLPAVRGGATVKVQPFAMPATGSVLVSNGTASPYGVVPVNGSCLEGVGSAWMAVPCVFSNSVTVTGSPVAGNLTKFSSGNIITSADLTGDVTTSGTTATTVGKIGGNAVALGGAFTLSGAYPFTGTVTGSTSVTFPTSGTLLANPMTTLGDIIYGGASGAATRLAGNTSSTPQFYTSTGTGSAATAPTLTSSTGTGSVVLSASPTLTGTVSGAAASWSTSDSAPYFAPTSVSCPAFGMCGSSSFNEFIFESGSKPAFQVNGASSFNTSYFATNVNSGTASTGPTLFVGGTDTTSALFLESKGGGNIQINTSGGADEELLITDTASAVDHWTLTGAASGNPGVTALGVAGSDTNITAKISSKGTGTVQLAGHAESALGPTTAPTCGTGCSSVTSGSTDVRGSLTTGSAVSSITLNFGTAWASTPYCVISDSTTATVADVSALSASALTVSTAANVTSVTVYWHCMQ